MSILFCVTVLKCVSEAGDEAAPLKPDELAESDSAAEMKPQWGDEVKMTVKLCHVNGPSEVMKQLLN